MIYDKVKAGADYGFSDWKPVEDSVSAAGCSCAILGCTELSLIKRDEHLPDSVYVDSLEVLACRCITLCGKQPIDFCRSLITFEGERDALFGAVN